MMHCSVSGCTKRAYKSFGGGYLCRQDYRRMKRNMSSRRRWW